MTRICPHLGGGVPRPGSDRGGGTPARSRQGRGVPQPGPAGRYPTSGTTLPPARSDWGGGGTPPRVTDGVLDTPRSVCLLRSRRRTFLYCHIVMCVSILRFAPDENFSPKQFWKPTSSSLNTNFFRKARSQRVKAKIFFDFWHLFFDNFCWLFHSLLV